MPRRLRARHTLELRHSTIKPAGDFFACAVANFYTRHERTLAGAHIFKVGHHHLSEHVPSAHERGGICGAQGRMAAMQESTKPSCRACCLPIHPGVAAQPANLLQPPLQVRGHDRYVRLEHVVATAVLLDRD